MKIAVIDDEKCWRQRAKREIAVCLENMKENMEILSYSSGEEFLEKNEAFDMVFMDVEMEGMNGFDVTYVYKQSFPTSLVAILTMHSKFASMGYKVNAFRYIDKARMESEIGEALSAGIKVLGRNKKISFHIVSMGDIQLIIRDIIFIETVKRNVQIHTRTGQYLSNQTISELEFQLKEYGFYLVHRSILVNMDMILKIDSRRRRVYLDDGSVVTVARERISELKKVFLKYTFEYNNM